MNITFLASFADTIKNWFTGWFGAILSFIPKIFYQLMTFIFAILDMLQYLVRKFAGLDNMTASIAGETNASGDLALYMINTIFFGGTVLTTVFWSMIMLGLFMLIVTTFIAVIKSEYTATSAKDAAKGPIIINALKGLVSFAVVPVVCFFGLYLGNIVLQLVDKLTNVNVASAENILDKSGEASFQQVGSGDQKTYYNYSIFGIKIPTTNTPISGIIFQSAAYGSNRARTNAHNFYSELTSNDGVSVNGTFFQNKGNTEAAQEQNAALIDQAFANTYKLKQRVRLDRSPFLLSHMFPISLSPVLSAAELTLFDGVGVQYFDKNNTALVWYYYDLWSFDFITCIAALVVVTKLLLDLCLGLVKRVFELTMLFLISAPMAALRPLDGGNASKQWTSQFVSKSLGVFGPIAGLNLFFIILSILTQIKLTGFTIIDKFIQILFVIVGLITVKDLTGMISKLVGGEDTLAAGSGISAQVAETAAKVGGTALKFAGAAGSLALGPAGMLGGKAVQRGVKKGWKTLKDKAGDIKNNFDSDFQKERGIDQFMEENGITDRKDAEAKFGNLSDSAKKSYQKMGMRKFKERKKQLKKDKDEFNKGTGRYEEGSTQYDDAISTYMDTHLNKDGKPASRAEAEKAIKEMGYDEKSKLFDVAASRSKIANYDNERNTRAEKIAREEYEKINGDGSWSNASYSDRTTYIEKAKGKAGTELINEQLEKDRQAKMATAAKERADYDNNVKEHRFAKKLMFEDGENVEKAGKALGEAFVKSLRSMGKFVQGTTKGNAGGMFNKLAGSVKLDEESRKKWFEDAKKKSADTLQSQQSAKQQASENFNQTIKAYADATKNALKDEIAKNKSISDYNDTQKRAAAQKTRDEQMITLLEDIKNSLTNKNP